MFITEAPTATVKILITKKYTNKARYNITVTREINFEKETWTRAGGATSGQPLMPTNWATTSLNQIETWLDQTKKEIDKTVHQGYSNFLFRGPHYTISRDFQGPRTRLFCFASTDWRSSVLDRGPNFEYPCYTLIWLDQTPQCYSLGSIPCYLFHAIHLLQFHGTSIPCYSIVSIPCYSFVSIPCYSIVSFPSYSLAS